MKAIPARIIEEPATDFIDICILSEKESIEFTSEYSPNYEEKAWKLFANWVIFLRVLSAHSRATKFMMNCKTIMTTTYLIEKDVRLQK